MNKYQFWLNQAYKGILSQGGSSLNKYSASMYKTSDGRKCPIGYLIPDQDYNNRIEGKSIISLYEDDILYQNNILPKTFNNISWDDARFLSDLQECHDSYNSWETFIDEDFLSFFKAKIKLLAEKYDLTIPNE